MSKKQIFQIAVIVLAFAASAWVLYNGLFKNDTKVSSLKGPNLTGSGAVGSSDKALEKILPYGDTLDFNGVLNKQNLRFGVLDYPKLNKFEVGIPESSLIQQPPQKPQ